ncbi:MAG: O-antigen ligase family protein [Pyrinomonadaceae bacterium]|nr:O-antigen ligase family protein [Pyrinomonadaceae bacterium]
MYSSVFNLSVIIYYLSSIPKVFAVSINREKPLNFVIATKLLHNNATFQKAKITAAIGAVGAAAIIFGAGIIILGSSSIAPVGAIAFTVICALIWFALELPVMVFVRFAFVASFFFKGEINFFKIDEIEDPSGLNISLVLVTGLILLIYDLAIDENRSEKNSIPIVFSLLFAGLLFCAGVSVIYSDADWLGWFSFGSLATSILVSCVVASHFGRRERLGELLAFVAFGLLLTGATALSQYVFNFPTTLDFFGTGTKDEILGTQSEVLSRVPAFLRTPTEMAWVVSALLPLVFAPVVCAVKNLPTRHKIILLTAGAAGIIAVILSLARGSWFGLTAAIIILIFGGWYRLSPAERKARIVPASAAILVAVLFFAPFAGKIYERLTADDDGSAAIRLPLLEVAGEMIADNPLVGVGLNNYRATMTKYDRTGIFVSQVFPNPVHNMFAHVTAEVGVAGGVIFCLLIGAAFVENWRTMRGDDRLLFALALAVFAGLSAFVISAMKEPGSLGSARPPMRTLFFLYGVTLALSRLRRDSRSR